MEPQSITWPWDTRKWVEIKQKICSPVNSIVDLDSRIASLNSKQIKPKQVMEAFNNYYTDDGYKPHRVPKEHFLENILPALQKMVSCAPAIFKDCNNLALCGNANVVYSRPQVAIVVTCLWFGAFNYEYITKGALKMEDFPEASLINIFTNRNMFAFQCLMTYFAEVYEAITGDHKDHFEAGLIIMKRYNLPSPPDWVNSESSLCDVVIKDNEETPMCKLFLVSANEYMGGEMFQGSFTQEEIALLTRPESLIATLVCSRIAGGESIVVLGAAKMSSYGGYGSSVRFMGKHNDAAPIGYSPDSTEIMAQVGMIFIDASPESNSRAIIFDNFARDLDKVYCGLSAIQLSAATWVHTSNWTYAFAGGNYQVRFIQQLLAASQTGKHLVYDAFSSEQSDAIVAFVSWLKSKRISVGGLIGIYLRAVTDWAHTPKMQWSSVDVFSAARDYY